MTNLVKRSLTLLLALFLCLSLLPVTHLHVHAANVEYVYDSTGKYIYNWGTRGTTATFLSQNAAAFYTGSNTYDALSALSGGTGVSDAPNSDLYKALKSLMSGAQTYQTSYDATRDLFKYTDCQNNGNVISSFYSGKDIGPTWDSGATWNREHTWPNSKGDASGNGENDIMMLRPTAKNENGSRGNKAYGESSSYYNPNGESGGSLDLRGDVSRILLYVYVRWGNTGSMWGSSGVIESLDVLIKWMEADPVDTWELGRNDSVQSITGTRNVFVDYPELAFLLFGEDIPTDMSTPSGKAASAVNCQHNYVPGTVILATCTTDGYTVYTCSLCSKSYNGDLVTASHKFVNGTCTACGEVTYYVAEELVPGTAYKLGLFSTNKNATYYFKGTMSDYYGATDTAPESGVSVFVEETNGGYYLYFLDANGAKQYINLVASGTYRNFTFATTASSVYTWDAEKTALYTTVSDEVCYIGTYGSYVTMGVLRTSKLKDTDYIARLYTIGGSSNPDVPACEHTETSVVDAKAATCTEAGHTGKTVCNACGVTVDAGSVITATGHSYVSGVCTSCGAEKPATSVTTATISFANKAQRTEYSTTKQVWQQNGITVTNLKAASTSNVGDYAGPARFYKSSSLKIEYPGMTKIVIDCAGIDSKYVTPYKDSITDSNATVSISNQIVTITFAQPVDSFMIDKASAQIRANSITITAAVAEPACEHANTTVAGKVDVTCTTDGYTGDTVCADCGETIEEGTVVTATGHDFVDGTCTKCGEADPNATPEQPQCQHQNTKVEGAVAATCTAEGHTGKTVCTDCGETVSEGSVIGATGHNNTKIVDAVAATCTAEGHTGKTVCTDCGTTVNAGSVIPTIDHNFVNGTCSACGEKEPAGPVITTATISFANKAQRTEFDSSKQVWEQNGITVTNLKAASSNAVADYANPARFYAGSSLQIEHPGMTKIEFTCNSSSYATALKNSIGSTASCTVSGSKVTVTFSAPQDSFQIAKMTAQVRVNSIVVTAETAPACEHANFTVEGAKAATCTTDGHTGKIICTDCGEVTDEGQVVPAPGHNYVNYFCSGCGELDPNAPKYTVYFLVPGGVNEIAPMVSDPNGITLPTAGAVEGYTFRGWVANAVDNVTEPVEFLNAGDKYVTQQDVCLYALYTYEKTTVIEATSGTANISFANKAQRTEFTSNKQVWQQNGITVTNLKAASSNAVADYASPARFYAGSSLEIAYSGMTKIEFTCNSSSYATALKNSIGTTATVSVSGSKVTVTFSAPQETFQVAKLTAQVRMNSLAVTYSIPGSEETATYYTTVIGNTCSHSNITVGDKAETCTEVGYKNAWICADCQAVLVEGETVEALGHTAGAAATCEHAQTCIRCDYVYEDALGHTAGAAATCETAQTCIRCDYVYEDALGHEAGAAATCETAQTCIRCDYVYEDALGHTAGVAATCETAQTCIRCDYVYEDALGHEAGAAATCETAQTCIRCDYVYEDALGHTAGAAATCEDAQTCTRCDYVYVAALGHEAGAAATCETAQTCIRCDYVYEDALGHTAGAAATCETAQTCTVCNAELVAALGHEAGAKATCTTAQTCVRCDYVYEDALGHDMHKYAGKEPTCTQTGWKEYESCSRCSRTTYTSIAAKGHSYKSTITEPTCTEEGYTTNTCSVCDEVSKTNTVAALGHKLNHVAGKDATVEAEGNIEYWTCQTCKGMWSDEACTKTTTEEAVVLAKLEAPATEATTVPTTAPVTDDITVGATVEKNEETKAPTMLWGGVIVLAVLGVAIVLGVKKFGKK